MQASTKRAGLLHRRGLKLGTGELQGAADLASVFLSCPNRRFFEVGKEG